MHHTNLIKPICSPCVSQCQLNEHEICTGCYRSIQEILSWRDATEAQKKGIIHTSQERRQNCI